MHYRKLWEKHHNKKIPQDHDIHHIDGDRSNNSISNLLCVHIDEHLRIHEEQGDWGAVQAILMRKTDREYISSAARKFQLGMIEEGKHNFQQISKKERSAISKRTMKERLSSGLGAFIIADPVENGRKAGKIAAQKKAGFLNTDSQNHGSKHVKNTCWWVNENNERKRSKVQPGPSWQKGMKYED